MERTRTSEGARPADGAPVETRHARARSRLRQALICPYCRDDVSRRGTVACARPGCGALYHRECWSECAASYGGCAVYGCGSTTSKEISAAGFVLRLLRLVVAAAIFPKRVARALREPGRGSLAEAFALARGVFSRRAAHKRA